uniref:Uncharacterized protein n=1 Tax=Vitis vinifera TaxID=29760 RepID=A5BFM3_VITVI|nr:hypothetical protein VITISV_017322 [Vitis vinifera]
MISQRCEVGFQLAVFGFQRVANIGKLQEEFHSTVLRNHFAAKGLIGLLQGVPTLLKMRSKDFGLCSGSLLRWHSLFNWSSQLVAMGFDGLRRVCGALLFRCMVAELCWHFSNFPWLCKVFLQTFLHFASQFHNLKVILKLGGDFVAISKLGDHFAVKWHFRRPFRSLKVTSQPISQLRNEYTGLPNGTHVPKSGFAVAKLLAEWGFSCENWEFLRFGISQSFCSCEMRVTMLQNGTRVPKVGFAAAKHPVKWGFGCNFLFFFKFRSCEMRFTVLQNGTRVPKVGFAAAKYPAEWSFGCEIGNFHVLELRSRFEAAK